MKMKKISKSRWAMLLFVIVAIVVLFNVAGCSVVQSSWDKINPNKIEVPVCEGEACEDIRG
jgi:uncharacterized phage infection (PIP) family protein YhgE